MVDNILLKGNYSEGADHHFNIGDYNKALSYNDSLYKITFHLYSTTENKLLKGRYIKQLEDIADQAILIQEKLLGVGI